MKRILYISFTVILLTLLMSCSRKAPETVEYEDLTYVADNYSLEDAKREDYVVIEDSKVTHGEDIWQDFVDLTKDMKPCKVRIVHYYTIGDPYRYDPAYYESIKDDYPMMFIFELVYNGETFSESHYEGDELYQNEYKYLMRYEGKAENVNASYSSYVRYVLVDDDKVTWNDIIYGMISSRSGDFIFHSQIYTDLIFKEDQR